ncbi:hypothetical protein [Bradyrhizobium sp. STM 3557]|uniref:hypothetical protein n=1 Tax=Bradyrhizobium sp. STM 3557 TaxID=578920 RepID=UPI00388D1D5F
MAILESALCKAHQNNINRYKRLLDTYLTDIERNFVEGRLSEEQAALRLLDQEQPSSRLTHSYQPAASPFATMRAERH